MPRIGRLGEVPGLIEKSSDVLTGAQTGQRTHPDKEIPKNQASVAFKIHKADTSFLAQRLRFRREMGSDQNGRDRTGKERGTLVHFAQRGAQLPVVF